MAGEVWIDQAQERLTRLDAHLIANVDFGWGILGKLDKGGTILLEQADIGGHDWEVTAMKLNLRGKALMVKSLSIQITQEASHFSLVPPPAWITARQSSFWRSPEARSPLEHGLSWNDGGH